jgi:hypothetical protein
MLILQVEIIKINQSELRFRLSKFCQAIEIEILTNFVQKQVLIPKRLGLYLIFCSKHSFETPKSKSEFCEIITSKFRRK